LKVAYLTQSYPPMVSGAAIVVQRIAQGVAEAGHEVAVLCASEQSRAPTSVADGVTTVRLRSLPNPLRVGQRFTLWPRREVATYIRSQRPDLLHFHDPFLLALAARPAAAAPGSPPAKVLTLHQLPWFAAAYLPAIFGLQEWSTARLWSSGRRIIQGFDVVVTPSEMIADIVAAHIGHRPVVISNGIDVQRFNPQPASAVEARALREKYSLDPSLPVILHVGRIDADKRVDLLVRAAAQVMHCTAAQLLIIGSGKRLPAVLRLAKELGIDGRCRFPGFVAASGDLPALYRLGAVFCTASTVEIQSSVVLEAAASGLPVVAFRSSSMPEFVNEGVSGHLVEPLDVPLMAERIKSLLSDQTAASAMGRAGRQIAEQHAAADSIRKHLALYESLLRR
jgi:glycosyltransferase involved in cell wall biosynthesis